MEKLDVRKLFVLKVASFSVGLGFLIAGALLFDYLSISTNRDGIPV